MTILYINEEHCTSLEQLRSYFEDSLCYDSPIFYDLLDYARSGDMSRWLREKGESGLADKVDGIDGKLGDSEYYSRLSALMIGNEATSDGLQKPGFSKCFHVEDIRLEKKADGMDVHVHLKVLSSVNETYQFSVRTSWGQRGDTINPFHEEEDGLLMKSFSFRKRPNIDFKDVAFLADGEELKDIQCVGLGPEEMEFEVGSCRFKMIRIEHGTFMMGATKEMRNPDNNEIPVHEVTLTKDYYIGETPVIQKLWEAVMGNNPSRFRSSDRPVENVSWEDCQTFITHLNRMLSEKLGKKRFALPTEAQWEFAARGGNASKHTQYSGSDNIKEVAWYNGNSGGKTHSVKTKKANELGIYDMTGNVLEWCQDWYGRYSKETQTNPTGSGSGANYVCRGGSWRYYASNCRLSYRLFCSPGYREHILGFRLVLSE